MTIQFNKFGVMSNKKLHAVYFVKYFCFLIILSPIIAYSEQTKEDYINSCDIVFTARYVQAGKTKRYLVEDIFKGSVDKSIMNYVILTGSEDETKNEVLLLFLIRNQPNFRIAFSVVNTREKFVIGHGDTSSSMSLEEIQGIIKKQSQESTKEITPQP
jgi:hypothetical protein